MTTANQPQTALKAPAAGTAPQTARRPFWRGCLTLIVTVVILFAALGIAVWLLRGTHAKPLDVKSYPFARTIKQTQTDNADHAVYLTGDGIDKVATFYINALGKANTENDNGCLLAQSPAANGKTAQVVQCINDISFLDITQFLSVNIQSTQDGSNQVVITVDRTW